MAATFSTGTGADRHFAFWPKGLPKTIAQPRNSLSSNLACSATRYPDRAAIVFYDAVVTYAELHAQADAVAGYLQNIGVQRGDRVALFSQNCPQFVAAFYGVMRADAVVVPINAMSTPDEIEHYLQDSGARVVIAAQEVSPRLADYAATHGLDKVIVITYSDALAHASTAGDIVPPAWVLAQAEPLVLPNAVHWHAVIDANFTPTAARSTADDLCLLPYTSGTTGRPKGCMHTHGSIQAAIVGSCLWRGLTSEAVALSVAPLFHLLGMQSGMNIPIFLGATVVMLPRWDRVAAARLIARHRVSVWAALPAMVVDFFAQPDIESHDLSSLTLLFGGGAAMPEAVATMLADRYGVIFNEAYGLTETAAFLHCNPLNRNKRQCIGVPTFGVDTRVIDPATLEELAPGEVGELMTSGAQVMQGYWNNEQANLDTFIERDGRRYMRTGDLGRVDEDGYFFMTDRLKRMINVSGYKVWPAEVESMLYGHPAVHEVCVIGVADPTKGESVHALIVLRPEQQGRVDAADIEAWAREHMSAYKVPRTVTFLPALPKSGTGKILWRQLQEQANAVE